jgi:hypothetical protein
MVAQSSIFPIFLRAEYREDGQGFARFQSDAQRAAQAAKREFEGVRAALDSALSRPRNTGGSLDLGVEEMRKAAVAQQQIAAAAREVAEATKRAATANGQFDAAMSRSTQAAFKLAGAEERVSREMMEQVAALEAVQRELNQTASATDLVTAANRRGTTATSNVINSQRASRTAFIQLGQQMQDVAVQAQLGTNAFIIFGQQVPQAAFALSGLADSANKTQAAVGRFATFLSGPYGAAIFVAIAVLGPFIQKLFESGEAADTSGRAQRSLAEVLTDTTSSYEEVTKAIDDYIRAQKQAQAVTIQSIQVEAEGIAQNLRKAIAVRELIKANLDLFASEARRGPTGPGGQGQIAASIVSSQLSSELAAQDAQIKKLTEGGASVRVAAATEIARIQSDAGARITEGFKFLRSEANRTIKDVGALSERLTQLNRDEARAQEALRKNERSDRSGSAAQGRRTRELQQLATFGEQAAEQIQRINERFDEQTRLVDQAEQSTRELDRIIKELSERKPAGFEKLIEQAQKAKRTVEEALLRPFEQLREESENRVAIEQALAAGRVDEATALQEIFRLQQQIGPLSYQQKQDVEDIVRLERERITNLRVQQALFQAQLDVVQTVRRDLTDLLSGRGTDFFKNFRQSLQDLQGQRLFEDLFGQAFRDIEEQLRGNTPQGRAQAEFTANTNEAATSMEVAGDAAISLAQACNQASRILSDGAANDNGGFNPGASIAAFVAEQLGIGSGITVEGSRRRSTKEIADQISKATVAGFLEPLRDILGDKFFNGLAGVLGNVLSAYVRGGEAGAVLQAGSEIAGLFKGGEGISKVLGEAVAGAETGTQIAELGKLLGIKGSRTGSQIGGALGAATGIPGGDIIGAIAGNIIGGMLKAAKRGSATIGNLGGALGITGTRGNSNSRIEQSTGLAGSALESIQNIASQLGANVDAARGSVSVGIRDKNIRLDTSGRGITKTSNGAIDFGDDAEAAVRAAVLDLIQDGVITGLRAAEQNLLRAGNDIEKALRDVLTFRSVFDRLQEIKDPLGFAIGQLNREFEGLIDLFERAGASTEEFASLEELYNLERARAIEEATDRVVGSLRQLLNDLTIGDSGLSLRSRRNNALGQFNGLAARVAAGDSSAFDEFADISQQLLDIERQLFGSTQSYFDRLAQITTLTEQAIADQTNVTSIGAGAPSPFDDRASVARAVEAASSEQVGWLRAINDNLIALNPALRNGTSSVSGGGRSTGPFPTMIQNF